MRQYSTVCQLLGLKWEDVDFDQNAMERPQVIQELLRHANLKVTMDTYVQAVTDEKRGAQSKVVKMLLPDIRKEVI